MADNEEVEEEAKSKKSKIKDPKILGVGGVVIAGLLYQFMLKAPDEVPMDDAVSVEEEASMEGAIYELEEMVLNLDEEDVSYLRVGVAVVLTETEDPTLFEADQAIAKDVIVDYLGSRSAVDLAPGEMRQKTKDRLSELMVEAYGEDRVVRVLFTALVMQ